MSDENLLKYIRDGLAEGRTEDVLRPMLVSVGWPAKDVDDAFIFIKTGVPASAPIQPASPEPAAASPLSQPQLQPLQRSFVSQKERRSISPMMIGAVIFIIVLLLGAGGAFAYYYIQAPPSPQQELDAAFQKGFAGVNSEDSAGSVAIDIHVAPTSTPAAAGVNAYAGAVLGGTPSEVLIQTNSSGTLLFTSGTVSGADQNIGISFSTKGEGQSMTFSVAGEFRIVDDIVYAKLSEVPNLGVFNTTAFEGRWIKLQTGSSTPGLAGATTTISAANLRKIAAAAEGMFTITKRMADETIGNVSNYHYQYDISRTGVENTILTIAAVGEESINSASTTLDASTTDDIRSGVDSFLDVFTSMGGELWIGKSDQFLHQGSLALAFSTSTPYGDVNGTVNATTTNTNLNGGQTIEAPADATDLQTIMQSAFASSSVAGSAAAASFGATQADGRDARRISDLHEIQNGLELYYNKCGRYPGVAAPSGFCPTPGTRISSFAALAKTLEGSGIGVTMVPNDPSTGATYYYGTDSTGQKYILAARLENAQSSVFEEYLPPSLAGISASGLTSCKAPMYCITL